MKIKSEFKNSGRIITFFNIGEILIDRISPEKLCNVEHKTSGFFLKKRLYSDFGYICHLYTRNKLLIKTNATYIKANFQCKTMQVDFKRDFVGEKCCQRWDSNQRSSILEHLALGVTHSCRFFTSLSLSQAKNCQLPVASCHYHLGGRQPARVAPGPPRLCIASLDRRLL